MSGNLNDLIGKTVKVISIDNDELDITVTDGEKDYRYGIRHFQDCCESVSLDSVDGNIHNMIGKKITDAYSMISDLPYEEYSGSGTRSVYRIVAEDDYLWLEWRGRSNGYYGEGVTFFQYDDDGSYSRW